MRHVLLVEDNLADVAFVQYALEHLGTPVTLHVTRDGEEALRFVRRQDEYEDAPWPSMMLLDLNLPRKNGFQVLRELKTDERLRTIPVVILSTSDKTADVELAYQRHASSYVVKPGSVRELEDIMRRLEHFWFDGALLPVERPSDVGA